MRATVTVILVTLGVLARIAFWLLCIVVALGLIGIPAAMAWLGLRLQETLATLTAPDPWRIHRWRPLAHEPLGRIRR